MAHLSGRRGVGWTDGAQATPAARRLDSLTGLRFLAALLVFANHIGDVVVPGRHGVAAAFSVGRVGVSFFFVLSGFVLAWSQRPSLPRSTFYRRRVARVFPNHVLTWFVAVAGLAVVGGLDVTGAALAAPLLQAWVPDPEIHFAANPPSWSLSCELFFYAVFPFAIGPALAMSARVRRAAMLAALGVTLLAPFAAQAVLSESRAYWAVYVLPLTRSAEFALGALLALELRDGRLPAVRLRHALLAVAVGYAVATQLPPIHRPVSATVVPFALLIVAAAQQDLAGRLGWTRRRSLVRLGEWSYAFYLVHRGPIAVVTATVGFGGHPPAVTVALVAATLAASIAGAAVLYLLVERPAEAWLRRVDRRSAPRRLRLAG